MAEQERRRAVYWRCELGHRFAVDPEAETCPERDYDGSWCGAPVGVFSSEEMRGTATGPEALYG